MKMEKELSQKILRKPATVLFVFISIKFNCTTVPLSNGVVSVQKESNTLQLTQLKEYTPFR